MLVKDLPLFENERWEYIEDFPNYIITDHGRIFNLKTGTQPKQIIDKGVNKKTAPNRKYFRLRVVLSHHSKTKEFTVHGLVAKYFIHYTGLNPDGTKIVGKPQINHIDEDTANNHYTNLEYCDCAYNNRVRSSNKYSNMSIEEMTILREETKKKYGYKSKEYHAIKDILYYYKKKQLEA